MRRLLQSKLLLLLLLVTGVTSWGQIQLANTTPVTQDFNSMSASSQTAQLPSNWKFSAPGATSPTWSAQENTTATNLIMNSSSEANSGGRYNYGASTNTDRAVGFQGSGNYAAPNSIMAFYRNTNAGTINKLTVSYDVERYRRNSGSASVQFFYSLNGSTWVSVPAGDVAASSLPTGSSIYGYPQLTVNVAAFEITNLNIVQNGNIYLRWNFNTGASNSQSIGLDNVSVTAAFAATAPTVTTLTPAATDLDTNTAVLSASVSANGVTINSKYFNFGETTAYDATVVPDQESATAFSTVKTGLSPNKVYHYQAVITYGTNATATGNDVSFTTKAKVPETVAVNGATGTTLNFTIDNVTQNGNPTNITTYAVRVVNGNNIRYVQADGALGTNEVFQTSAQWGTKTVTGLSYNTTYTFSASAKNTAGIATAYGNVAQGVTLPNTTPALSAGTLAAFANQCINTASAANSFTVNGINLTQDAVVVGPFAGYTFSAAVNGTYTNTVSFTATAQGNLTAQVFVKFTPVAVQSYNGNIPVSGGNATAINIAVSGTGINTLPTVTTAAVTNLLALSATLGGTIGSNGCSEATTRGVVYGPAVNPEIGGQDVINVTVGSGTGTFTTNIAGLLPQTTYNVRAYTISAAGTITYGSNIAFTTPAYTQPAPVALPATDILNTSFTANWNLAAGADAENGYRLDVSTYATFSTPGSAGTTTIETFENAPTISNTYLSGSYTGVGNITWSYIDSRTDSPISTGKALTIRNGSLTSGEITGGLSRIKFETKLGFGTGTGSFTIDVLTGTNYSTVSYTGTMGYSTTLSNFDSGVLNIPGNYKIRITNNSASQRPAIDNLSYSSLPTSVPSFVPGYENVVVSGTSQAVTGLVQNTTYYYRVRAVNTQYGSTVVSGNSNVIEVKTADPFIWTNGGWSKPGTPGVGDEVYITSDFTTSVHNAGNPTTTQNELTAKSIRVTGGTLRVSPLTTVTIVDGLTVLSPGAVVVESDGSLRQTNPLAVNTGNVRVLRDNGSLYRLDYSLWSSPVGGQNLLGFSPLTALNRFYKYDTAQNLYISNTHDTTFNPATDSFETGKGYLIRMPNSNPAPGYNQGTAPVTFSGDFTGTLTNGTIAVSLSTENLGYNAIGNPYASPVDADAFLTQNAEGGSPVIGGTLYFWRKRNAVEGDAYATYTKMGGVAGSGTSGESGNGELVTATPTGVILPGQGFIVKALQGGSQNLFANTQRLAAIASNFFRSSNATEKHRMWFTLTSPQGVTYNSLIGYMQGATNEVDNAIDGERFNTANDGFYSVINNNQYAVQGRALPFTVQDEVVMGYRANNPGTYSITLDKADGLFLQGQPVYLKDRVTGTQHNIKEGAYSFTTEAGTFNDRFVVVYTDAPAMGTKDNTISADSVVVYKQGAGLVVSTGVTLMDSVRVYDIQGGAIYTKNNVNAATLTIGSLPSQQQVLIVQVSTPKGTVSKKVVF